MKGWLMADFQFFSFPGSNVPEWAVISEFSVPGFEVRGFAEEAAAGLHVGGDEIHHAGDGYRGRAEKADGLGGIGEPSGGGFTTGEDRRAAEAVAELHGEVADAEFIRAS